MPTDEVPTEGERPAGNEQRRQQAKRKLANTLARRAVRTRQRRNAAVAGAVIVVLVAAAGAVYLTTEQPSSADSAAAPASPASSGGPCSYTSTPDQPASKPVSLPPDPDTTPNRGSQQVSLRTNQGTIPITLDRAAAPCTAQNFEHLARSGFFDGTDCHRIADDPKMLQCGDPSGTGRGGPGYRFRDETTPATKYPRGTLAMANSGPDTNGSQFFMVYGDAPLPPNYTAFGTVDPAGLQVIDKVAAGGDDGSNGPGDGKPRLPVHIDAATAA